MGIRIELVDDDLPEVAQEMEITTEEVETATKNPRQSAGEQILFMICGREDGGVEIRPGNDGYILLRSEKEAEQFCESVIRQIRRLPTFRQRRS